MRGSVILDFGGLASARQTPPGLLFAAIYATSTAVAVCDTELKIQFFNQAFSSLLGPGMMPADEDLDADSLLGALKVERGANSFREAAEAGAWRGVGLSFAGGPQVVAIVIERFGDAADRGGWLITARAEPAAVISDPAAERELISRSTRLTPREREVMLELHTGETNKAIARKLNISARTVEFHRARIMKRFAATSIVGLVRNVTAEAWMEPVAAIPSAEAFHQA